MRKLFFALVLVVSFMLVKIASAQTPQWIQNLPAAKDASQILVVAQLGEKTTAWVSLHERDADGSWQEIITTPAFIGRNGLGKTREGDAKTPVGTFHFTAAFGLNPDPGCLIPYTQVDANLYWSGDPNFHYNEMVDIRDCPRLNTDDSEHLIDYNPHYTYALNLSYNEAGTAGKGSAIFLHCFGPARPWTGGCVAIPLDKMTTVMQTVRPDCVVVIDTLNNLGGTI